MSIARSTPAQKPRGSTRRISKDMAILVGGSVRRRIATRAGKITPAAGIPRRRRWQVSGGAAQPPYSARRSRAITIFWISLVPS